MPWKCKNPDCRRTFEVLARISHRKRPPMMVDGIVEILIEKPCCPYCESIEFESVPPAQETK